MTLFDQPIVVSDLQYICESTDWSTFAGKTILITGANGHIATYLAYSFLYAVEERKLDVTIVVLSRDKEKMKKKYSSMAGRTYFHLLATDVCEKIGYKKRIDYIFHFAGNASPHFIQTDPVGILKTNVQGTFNIAELAIHHPGCKIIYASTREVYGQGSTNSTLSEKSFGALDPLEPRSCYPESKRAAETILEAYRNQYGIRYATARIAHCYGPGMNLQNDGRVMADFLDSALSGNDITIHTDGSALRSFCYIADVISGILAIAADKSDTTAFNLSNETEEISILDLAYIIAEKTSGIHVKVMNKPINPGRYCTYKRTPLDCSTLTKLGWNPQINLKNGIHRTLDSFFNL